MLMSLTDALMEWTSLMTLSMIIRAKDSNVFLQLWVEGGE